MAHILSLFFGFARGFHQNISPHICTRRKKCHLTGIFIKNIEVLLGLTLHFYDIFHRFYAIISHFE